MVIYHGRSQPKTWGGVELENFDLTRTSLKLAHYDKKYNVICHICVHFLL